MRYFSLFSGIGGFELGIKQAYEISNMGRSTSSPNTKDRRHLSLPNNGDGDGWRSDTSIPECIGFSEIDKYAVQIYQRHFRQPKTREEIENDLDSIKTIVSENNYYIMNVCYANIARKETSFIKTTSQNVKTALDDTSLSGVKTILKKAGQQGENIMLCEDSECSICMGEDVFVAENLKKCSLPLNIKTEMDTLSESNMELAICINAPLKNIDQTDTKSCATTVITLKEDTIYAHIKKTKPHKNWGDVTKIDTATLPDFDFLCGGFPCQAFSIAGKRKGFEDTRGTLFFEIARILRAKQPRLLLLENVKGLLSHDNGRTFSTIISTLDELGYDLQWQVLNSKNFGVPQNRERVFIIGHLRGTSRPQVFPIGDNNRSDIKQDKLHTGRKLLQRNVIKRFQGEETETTCESGGQGASDGGNITNDSNSRGRKTYTTYKIRRLTPKECERLQGFPDGWTEGVSDTQRYKCLGNAVTVNVIREIIKEIQ